MKFYGETAGADMQAYKAGKCGKCNAPLLVGQVRGRNATLKWHNYEAVPAIRGGLRYYRPHRCPDKPAP